MSLNIFFLYFSFLSVFLLLQNPSSICAQNNKAFQSIEQEITTSTVSGTFPENSYIRSAVVYEYNKKSYYAVIYSTFVIYRYDESIEGRYYFALLDAENLKIIDQISINAFLRYPGHGKIQVYDFSGDGKPDYSYTSYCASGCNTLNILRMNKHNKLIPVEFSGKKGQSKEIFFLNIWIEPGRIENEMDSPGVMAVWRTIYAWNKITERFELVFKGDNRRRTEWFEEVARNRKSSPMLLNELEFDISTFTFRIFHSSIPENQIYSNRVKLPDGFSISGKDDTDAILKNGEKNIYYSSFDANAGTDNIYSLCLTPSNNFLFFGWDSWDNLDTYVKLDAPDLENAFIVGISSDGEKMGNVIKLPKGLMRVHDMSFTGKTLWINGSNFTGTIEFSKLP